MKKTFKIGLTLLPVLSMLSACSSTTTYPVTTKQTVSVEQECSSSFWKDCVNYPFPVKYAFEQDSKGVDWQIAYMDEYMGTDENPEIVVLIHGKGVYGGYYAELMEALLAQGYRVVVPDLPNYGKSIPGNLNNSLIRSLDDTRDAIHNLLSDTLNIKKAHFLGHSMGGQWVIGYALKHPTMVDKIVLEAPGGIEEFPTEIAGMPLFGESQANSYKEWQQVWGSTLDKEKAKTSQDIELFNYFKTRNKNNEIQDSPAGYFLTKTPMTEYITHTRQYMIDATPEEFNAWTTTYIRDVYSMGKEVRIEDPNSLVKRIADIQSPILIAFGEKEPFIPTTIFSGKKDLKWEVIKPVYTALKEKGNAPQVIVYPDVAHFVHTDIPATFNNDVITFLSGKTLKNADNVEQYQSPLVTPPENVEQFFSDFRKDLLRQDKKVIARYYAEDFLENGFDKDSFLQIMFAQMSKVKEYKVSLTKFEQDKAIPNEYFIEGVVDLGIMKIPFKQGSKIRETAEGWRWLGNRR